MVHYSMLIYKLQAAKKIFKMRCSNEIFDETERHDPSSCLSLSGRGGQDNKRKDCGECKDKSRLYPSADVCVKKGRAYYLGSGAGECCPDENRGPDHYAGYLPCGRRGKAASPSGYTHQSGVRRGSQYPAGHR